MAGASDLVTLVVAKLYLGSPDTDDAYVERLVSGASEAIDSYCGHFLKARDLVEIYDGDNTVELFLHNYPINSIASIYQDSTRTFAIGSLVPATDYLIDQDKRIVYGISVCWLTGLQTIQVTYNAGLVPIPSNLQTAALIIIDFWYKSFSDHRFGVKSVSIGDKTISYETDIPKQAKNLLSPYRNRVIF